jgi:hypothetical protein
MASSSVAGAIGRLSSKEREEYHFESARVILRERGDAIGSRFATDVD